MTSDIERKIDEIDQKLQTIIEKSYLAKLDLMFSVLVSSTIFGAGLLLRNFSLEKNVLLISLEAFFPVLVYTLIGEAYSILKDDVVNRFGFWLALISNIIFVLWLSFIAFVLLLFESLPIPIFLPSGIIISYMIIYALNKYVDFFWHYIKQFPSRFPNPRETYSREMGRLLKPMIIGLVIYAVAFLVIATPVFLASI